MAMRTKFSFFLCMLVLISGCSSQANVRDSAPLNTSVVPDSLFVRIGGLPMLTQIVDEFIDNVTSAPKTKRSFEGLNLKTLKKTVTDQLCHLTGGGCVYEGETMLNAHKYAKISEAEFEVFVSMFRDTLNKYVGTREKNELLKILAPMKRDIVTNPKNISTPAETANQVPANVSDR